MTVSRVALWDAINSYTVACNGDTGERTVGDKRMMAVMAVERTVDAELARLNVEVERLTRDNAFTSAQLDHVNAQADELVKIIERLTPANAEVERLREQTATHRIVEGPFWAVMLPDGTLRKQDGDKSPVLWSLEKAAVYDAQNHHGRAVRVKSVNYEVEDADARS